MWQSNFLVCPIFILMVYGPSHHLFWYVVCDSCSHSEKWKFCQCHVLSSWIAYSHSMFLQEICLETKRSYWSWICKLPRILVWYDVLWHFIGNCNFFYKAYTNFYAILHCTQNIKAENTTERKEGSDAADGGIPQNSGSETDLTVVLNAWFSAGFYTGR